MKTQERTWSEIRTSSPAHSGTQDLGKGRGGEIHTTDLHTKKAQERTWALS